MRSISLIILIIGTLVALSYYFLGAPEPFDKPQPVPEGETEVQKIRGDDGQIETWTYRKKVLLDKAESNDRVAVTVPPTGAANLLNEQALNAWNSGDIAGALALFEDAIAADPNDPEPHSNYGRRLTIMIDYDKALPLLQRAAELKPDDPQVWLDLLTLYDRTLQFQAGNAARQQAHQVAGDREFVRNEQGMWLLEGGTLP